MRNVSGKVLEKVVTHI